MAGLETHQGFKLCCLITLTWMVFSPVSSKIEPCWLPDWVFNPNTRPQTCMRLFDSRGKFSPMTYQQAKQECHSKQRNAKLLIIDSQQTEALAKGLLSDRQAAWIGLDNTGQTDYNVFVWSDNISLADRAYVHWAPGQPLRRPRQGAFLQEDGWRTTHNHNREFKFAYICQVDAELPPARLDCPKTPVQSGTQSVVTCQNVLEEYAQDLDSIQLRMRARSGLRQVHNCNTPSCTWDTPLPPLDSSGVLECDLHYGDSRRVVKTCPLQTYDTPARPRCTHSFKDKKVLVECSTAKVLPKASCSFARTVNGIGNDREEKSFAAKHVTRKSEPREDGFQTTTCTLADAGPFIEGQYQYTVTMRPDIKLPNVRENGLSTTGSTVFAMRPPEDPPIFFIDGDRVQGNDITTMEGKDLNITCRIPGGTPGVQHTSLSCLSKTVTATQEGTEASVVIKSVKTMYTGRSCKCWGSHLVKRQTDVGKVTFKVQYPPKAVSITANSQYLKADQEFLEVAEGDITLKCGTEGVPAPALAFFHGNINLDGSVTYPEGPTRPLLESVYRNASCGHWPKLSCVSSSLGTRLEKEFYLRPKCTARFANPNKLQQFAIPDADNPIIYIDIVVYPAPIEVDILGQAGIQISLNNSQAPTTKVAVDFTNVLPVDKGHYSLVVRNQPKPLFPEDASLAFSLVDGGLPECPKDFHVADQGSRNIVLQWTSGYDGGLPQVFVLVDDLSGAETRVGDPPQGDVEVTVAGPASGGSYSFTLETENSKGRVTGCGTVGGTLAGQSGSDASSPSPTTVIVVVIVLVVLLVLVVLIVILVKKRRERKTKAEVLLIDDVNCGNTRDTGDMQSGALVGEWAGDGDVSEKPKIKSGPVPSDDQPKDKTKGESTEPARLAPSGDEDGGTYMNMDVLATDFPETQRDTPTSPPNTADTQEDDSGAPSRYLNQEGLVYVEVEIGSATGKPKMQPQASPKPKPRKKSLGPVQYTDIQFNEENGKMEIVG